MARQVKCKCCGEKIDKDSAYCAEKTSEKTGRVTREYYHSEKEYLDFKENKSLWVTMCKF